MTKLKIQRIYLSRLDHLSRRARNILTLLKLEEFEKFFKFFVEEKNTIDFGRVKNCGYATEQELDNLVRAIMDLSKEIKLEKEEYANSPFAIDELAQLMFDKEFDKLA